MTARADDLRFPLPTQRPHRPFSEAVQGEDGAKVRGVSGRCRIARGIDLTRPPSWTRNAACGERSVCRDDQGSVSPFLAPNVDALRSHGRSKASRRHGGGVLNRTDSFSFSPFVRLKTGESNGKPNEIRRSGSGGVQPSPTRPGLHDLRNEGGAMYN